ncbi:MAG: carboxylesterase family protein [Clostridiaceae bacterium]|jgi:para-nitrobenzyl esterase|nr:carboxylesterase family protein [Clostridiaceae bacterium]
METQKTIANTGCGTVEGLIESGIYVWKGIPYARPPVGEFRFRAPVPHDAWEGIRPTKKYGATCPQIMALQIEPQSEDCLYLNVFSKDPNDKMPVLVFIHGGAFAGGSSSQYIYHGHNFAEIGIVTVTLNYRLGALGMFDFSEIDGDFVSNIALRDQTFALKWVHENIAAFGGDPDNVTIMGQSAGAISIVGLLNVPSAAPYFKRAAALSAFPNMFKTKEESLSSARAFLKFAGISTKEELLKISAKALTAKARHFMGSTERRFGLDYIMPAADGDFLPRLPLESAKDGADADVPLLMSYTNNETEVLFRLPGFSKIAYTELDALAKETSEYVAEFEEKYGDGISAKANIGRDLFIKVPTEWYAEYHCSRQKTWLYRFDYSSNLLKLFGIKSVHALDLIFLFKTFDNPLSNFVFLLDPSKKRIFELAARVQGAVAEFIRTGECPWEAFNESRHIKAFDASGDSLVELDTEINELWKRTRFYKDISTGGVPEKFNLSATASLAEPFKYVGIGEFNDCMINVIQAGARTLDFHKHENSDEMFYVIEGKMQIEFRHGTVDLSKGDLIVVPKGTEHRTIVKKSVKCMLIEKRGTLNPSNTGGEFPSE